MAESRDALHSLRTTDDGQLRTVIDSLVQIWALVSHTALRELAVAAACVTAVGSILIVQQIKQNRAQFRQSFADDMTAEYRELIEKIPVGLLLELDEYDPKMSLTGGDNGAEDLNLLYNYFDLTNQQIWLRQDGRVDDGVWENWQGGIRDHLQNQHFVDAWKQVEAEMGEDHFEALHRFIEEGLSDDLESGNLTVDDSWDPRDDDELNA